MRRLRFLLLLMITLFKQQVSDGVSNYVKILSIFYDNLDTTDLNNREVIICGLKRGDAVATCETLSNMFGYFKVIRVCHDKLRYFDWDGQVHFSKGKTGGH